MAQVQEMPRLSDTMEKGHLVRWLVKEGDRIRKGDPLAEVETDKATMEAESFHDGVVLKLLIEAGTDVLPGTPMAVFGVPGEVWRAQGSPHPAAPTPGAPSAKTSSPTEPSPPTIHKDALSSTPSDEGPSHRIMASPLARSLAREAGLDLGTLAGSGPHGRIVRADIDAALLRSKSPPPLLSSLAAPVSLPTSEEGERLELTPMRVTIARRLAESKFSAPHYYLAIEVDMEPAALFRSQIEAQLGKEEGRLSYNDLVIKAAALALREVPEVNSSWRGDHLLHHSRIHVGVAVALEGGLITPVVRDADRLGLREIARQVRDLAARAKERRLKPEEYQGSTFSVSNLGMMGIERFTAIIQPGEAAILAVGGVVEKPVVKDGGLMVGKRMVVTLSCDHRVVDGAVGARWIQVFRAGLEQPFRLVL